MPDRYQSLLQTAYNAFIASGANYPAVGKDAKPVLQPGHKDKVDQMVNGPAPSLASAAGACGQVMAKAEAKGYADRDALEAEATKSQRLLNAQVQALADLFEGFKREETAWIKQGATLSWDPRSKAVTAQRATAQTFVAAVQAIATESQTDLSAAAKSYPSGGQPGPDPHPDPDPHPQPEPLPVDLTLQREALINAALNGAPCVAIDPALLPPTA